MKIHSNLFLHRYKNFRPCIDKVHNFCASIIRWKEEMKKEEKE